MDFIKTLFIHLKLNIYFFFIYIIRRLKFVILISCIIFSLLFAFFLWFTRVNYVVLYNHLSDADSKWVISKLQDLHISYRFYPSTKTLSVPKDKFDELHFSLINNNSIIKKNHGFNLLDKEQWGVSQFRERINYYRGLEEELSNTLEHIFPIQYARIHLACKKDTDFFQDSHSSSSSSASVVVSLFPNTRLKREQIDAIVLLVAGSVPDLSTENIVLIDQFGHILNKLDLNQIKFFNKNKYKKNNFLEEGYRRRINKILIPICGLNNFTVNVSVDTSLHSVASNHANLRTLSEKRSLENSKEGVSSNLIPSISAIHAVDFIKKLFTGYFVKDFSNKDYFKDLMANNFFLRNSLYFKKKIIFLRKDRGLPIDSFVNLKKKGLPDKQLKCMDKVNIPSTLDEKDIKRLTVTVLINYKKNNLGLLVPLSSEELSSIEKLVSSVIDFSKTRGDRINIINYMFNSPDSAPMIQMDWIYRNYNIYFLLVFFLFFAVTTLLLLFLRYQSNLNKCKNENMLDSHIPLNVNNDDILNKKDFFIKKIMLNKSPKIIARVIRHWIKKK